MGSVSSLVAGNSLNSKHCKASDYRLKEGTNTHRKSGGCNLDGLLKCGFAQSSSSTTHHSRGTLSDSGRNSMSSLPTHSTSGSLRASTGLVSQNDGRQQTLSETAGGIRSPITTDELLIEHLEQRLLERENELQELQVSLELKEAETCHLFEERQKFCAEEMDGLKQRCTTQLREVSQMNAKTHQALQLQVCYLQKENGKLQEDLSKLTREKDLVELRLRSYEKESTQLVPTLEETQWEVCQKSGEISLLKQQLRDCQADVSHKLNEIVSLKASLKENTAKVERLEQQNKDYEDKLQSCTREVEVYQNELQRKKVEADFLRDNVGKLEQDIQQVKQDLVKCIFTGSLQREVERLKQELREEKNAQGKMVSSFELERQTWNQEKDRVIKYQKQLQINYLQMHKKNKDLERILKELTAELESRTELGLDLRYSAGLQTYEDVIATEI
uniref:Leucine zipper tumor suppressor 1 n=1 Tax=Poecilia latipinna TaxID=48699 RepID=A0A3B3U8U3_9TELE